jgi:hypothetical protein
MRLRCLEIDSDAGQAAAAGDRDVRRHEERIRCRDRNCGRDWRFSLRPAC